MFPDRLKDPKRNHIINRCHEDLKSPYPVFPVWDRLDLMAMEIENHLMTQQLKAKNENN